MIRRSPRPKRSGATSASAGSLRLRRTAARRRRPTHRRLAAVAAVAVASVSTAAGLRAGSDVDGRAGTPVRVRGDSVVAIDPATNRVVDAVRVGHTPSDVVVGGGAVWSLNADTRTLSRIDPTTGTAASFATGREPTGIAAGASAVWVGSASSGSRNARTGAATSQLARIGARSRAIELTVDIGRGERASTKRQQIALGPRCRVGDRRARGAHSC